MKPAGEPVGGFFSSVKKRLTGRFRYRTGIREYREIPAGSV
jgi:hypothetical protein